MLINWWQDRVRLATELVQLTFCSKFFFATIIMNNLHSSVNDPLFSESRILCSTPFDLEAPSFFSGLHY